MASNPMKNPIDIVKMLRFRVCTNPCATMTFESQCDCALDVIAANHIEALERSIERVTVKRMERLERALQEIAQHDMQALALDALYPGERAKERKRE